MDPVLLVLLEAAAILGGVFGTLVGYRVVRGSRASERAYAAWYARHGRHLKWIGPWSLFAAAAMPVIARDPIEPTGKLLGVLLVVGLVAIVVRTWRPGPPVARPRGVIAVAEFALGALLYGGVLAGAVAELGIELEGAGIAIALVCGAVIQRVLDVWFARFAAR